MPPLVEIDIDPVIVWLGPFALRWYSLMIMVGVLVGTWVAARMAAAAGDRRGRRLRRRLWIVVGGILGARLAHVIDRFDYYRLQPLKDPGRLRGGAWPSGGR